MDIWESYRNRLDGVTERDAAIRRTVSYYDRHLPASPSYEPIVIDGEKRWVAIINSDNYNEKTLITQHGERIFGGELVEFADNYWLVTSVDPRQEIYAKAKLIQCNYVLRWIVDDEYGNKKIVEQHCIVEDGTKYLTGETTSNYAENGMVLGDTRISVTFARNKYTAKIGRKDRFLIDDYGTEHVLSYRVTKPFKFGGVYNEHGAMSFVMQECNTEKDDNLKLHIADYYKYFPRESEDDKSGEEDDSGKKVWL